MIRSKVRKVILGNSRFSRKDYKSTAHFMKKRGAEISAQGYLRTVDELYDVIAVKERVQPPNSGLADNGRSMNANKLLRVKFSCKL